MNQSKEIDKENLVKEVAKVKYWHHYMDFGAGVETKTGKEGRFCKKFQNWILSGIPQDLTGKTVLDIGAWDGFYSFSAEKRGAKRVLATDSFIWEQRQLYGLDDNFWRDFGAGKQGFELARKMFNSQVEDYNIDVLDFNPEKIGTFDVVFFLGVLYHMKYPLYALEKVRSVTKELLILETHISLFFSLFPVPLMRFYPTNELSKDVTNWTGANIALVKSWLLTAGFSKVELVKWRKDRAIFHAWV
ncbi:MAG: TIGR04290 family methyltransferase [Geminocystis sp.]